MYGVIPPRRPTARASDVSDKLTWIHTATGARLSPRNPGGNVEAICGSPQLAIEVTHFQIVATDLKQTNMRRENFWQLFQHAILLGEMEKAEFLAFLMDNHGVYFLKEGEKDQTTVVQF